MDQNNQNHNIARETALEILKEVNQDGKYANISLKENLRGRSLTGRDAAFVTQLVYGTLEKQIAIDYFLKKFATFKRVNPWIINILRLGAYQILYLDRVPDSAACNEAVKLCKKHGLFALQGFVNGILRNVSRSKEKLLSDITSLPSAERLSLRYSYPLWLAKKWIRDYGEQTAEAIMTAPDNDSLVSIRANLIKTTIDSLREQLTQSGINAEEGVHFEDALRVSGMGDVEDNALYRDGWFAVQGESSMLAVRVTDPQPGESILDACSSPGGKAVYMAQLMNNKGRITAWDIHPHRVELIEWNKIRMGASIVKPVQSDASVHHSELKEAFDRILIDAPCSGLGVIHKKPDIKNRIAPEMLAYLPELQYRILEACSSYVKAGGVLVYSTCTINPAENNELVIKFLENHPDFALDDPSPFMPVSMKDAVKNGMIQLIPSLHKTDGFFIARMRRVSRID